MNKNLTKKDLIKKYLLISILTLVLTSLLIFFNYGKIPLKPFIYTAGILIILFGLTYLFEVKFIKKINKNRKKIIAPFFIILGLLNLFIGIAGIITQEINISFLLHLIAGIGFLIMGTSSLER